jgi:hypothetical protein
MSTIDDFYRDELIARLVGPLSPPDHIAFRHVADEALARAPCWGEAAVCGAVVALHRRSRYGNENNCPEWAKGKDRCDLVSPRA